MLWSHEFIVGPTEFETSVRDPDLSDTILLINLYLVLQPVRPLSGHTCAL